MSTMPPVFVLLLTAAATWSSFFLVADAQRLEPAQPAGRSCIERERDALLAFKQGIDDDGGDDDYLELWQPGDHDCCRWVGVTCSSLTGHVVKLDLSHERLVGQMRSSLLSLEHLRYLGLSWISLQCGHGRPPEFLGSFQNLRHLDLVYASCSSAPPLIGNLSQLEYFELTSYYFYDGQWLTSYKTSED